MQQDHTHTIHGTGIFTYMDGLNRIGNYTIHECYMGFHYRSMPFPRPTGGEVSKDSGEEGRGTRRCFRVKS